MNNQEIIIRILFRTIAFSNGINTPPRLGGFTNESIVFFGDEIKESLREILNELETNLGLPESEMITNSVDRTSVIIISESERRDLMVENLEQILIVAKQRINELEEVEQVTITPRGFLTFQRHLEDVLDIPD